ncbi:hypothetical protein [Streptomyces sp. NPDC006463]
MFKATGLTPTQVPVGLGGGDGSPVDDLRATVTGSAAGYQGTSGAR